MNFESSNAPHSYAGPMLLTLVRHGDANPPNNSLGDMGRCLSLRGREQARATGRALALQVTRLTHVWTSPLARAVQTTELMLAALAFEGIVETRDDLLPDSSPSGLLQALGQLDPSADVLVVGHMPYMASLASELLGMHVGGFSTCGALRVELESPSQRATPIWKN
jgi:phosphohistidine phosphatase